MKTLKHYLLFIIFYFTYCQNVSGQNLPTPGDYITNNTMGSFVGDWRWVNGTDTIQIRLIVKKIYFDMNGGFYMDNIVGWHIYKRNQNIIESSYQYINDVSKSTYKGNNNNNPVSLWGMFNDITKNKSGELELTINTSVIPNQLNWKLKNSEGVKVRTSTNQAPFDFGFTLPVNITLTKL